MGDFAKILSILKQLAIQTTPRNLELCARCIQVLSDNATPSNYAPMKKYKIAATLADGLRTALIAEQIQTLEQRNEKKPDREGRDVWIKPLTELGILRKGFLESYKQTVDSEKKTGAKKVASYRLHKDYHAAKSSNNFYFISEEFSNLLGIRSEDELQEELTKFASITERGRELQVIKEVAEKPTNLHSKLIQAAVDLFTKSFLKDYELIYIDDEDGDRITEEEEMMLQEAGLKLGLNDRIPDAILWNRNTQKFWLLDAVEHDGEFDVTRVKEIRQSFESQGLLIEGFTTLYSTWKKAYSRQSTYKNLAPGTTVWIAEDAGKLLSVNSIY